MVLLAKDKKEMQIMSDFMNKWCFRWQMAVNMFKSKVMHFRPKSVNRCMTYLYLEDKVVEYTESYKYLGVYFNEHLEFEEHCKILSVRYMYRSSRSSSRQSEKMCEHGL